VLAFVPEDLPAYSVVSEISAMTDCASSMLKNGLQAFVTNDATAARKVIQRELEINKLYSRVFHTLLRLIVSKLAMATAHARQLLVAKHVERIGNYITDICELTVYMATAEIMKHTDEH
jgi:phosphate transport system protein